MSVMPKKPLLSTSSAATWNKSHVMKELSSIDGYLEGCTCPGCWVYSSIKAIRAGFPIGGRFLSCFKL
ncbi:hypothetical protein E2562_010289 [Oryza meyeriana var. granulata]|uniref:Uncharacterized protein n=1 Tax=Oryza meyeriana var. granulata TaxID=110450 RepID=A0A6G1EIX4_9ORYZ|nr:hypothetical protein E2562_010289 [Oryza meyeriana var. granulata]